MEKPNGENLRLAIQRGGRLTDDTVALLRSVGLDFESYHKRLFTVCDNFPMEILFGRDDDIPEYVANGTVDIGIVGRNLLHEANRDTQEILPLGFGFCSLVLAVPKDSHIKDPEELEGKRIATSYPNSARKYFQDHGVQVEIVELSGSVEVAPNLGIASAIVELTATGSTMIVHDIKPIRTILRSEAVLAINSRTMVDPHKSAIVDRLVMRLKMAMNAKRFKYIMMNAPRSALPRIQQITPGLRSPTVVPLAREGYVAIHTAVREDEFWDVIEALKEAGASEILVSAIEKMLL
jgi:ATP phosphoribosyltransferase